MRIPHATEPRACRLAVGALLCALVSLPACGGPQEIDPAVIEESHFHFQLAAGHFQAHEIPFAIRELHRSLELYPENERSLFLLGFIYHGRRDYEEAMRLYRRTLEVRPGWHEVKNNLGVVYLELERWEEAAEIFAELTRSPVYGTPGHGHNNLGWAYYNMGQYREALEQFELASMLQPEHCLAYNNQGLAHEQLGNMRDALTAYERAIRRCANYPEPRYRLGVLLINTGGDIERARDLLQECYDTMPEAMIGQRCLEYLSVTQQYP